MQKMLKNSLSYPFDEQKIAKTTFRPWPKAKKWRKSAFGHGRKTRNGKNSVSAAAETEIMPQKRFSQPLGKGKNASKTVLRPLGSRKADASTEFT
ncbi:hypothetical protein HMPREF2992_01430 [Prevotella sp. HMSC069G02]|nr:hypothetical protein HMPREF2992_01430 [Prevotella sp. HMSC069G02]